MNRLWCNLWCSRSLALRPRYYTREVVEYKSYPLLGRDHLTRDTQILTFKMPEVSAFTHVPLGHHLILRANINNKNVTRPYSVIHSNHTNIELLVKLTEHGLMSQFLRHLKVGDSVEMAGPHGNFTYTKGKFDYLCIIAGGSGIAPIFQILKHITNDKEDETHIKLLYANRSAQDIPLKSELTNINNNPTKNTKIIFVVGKDETGEVNSNPLMLSSKLITPELLKLVFPILEDPSNLGNTQILICGPVPMEKAVLEYLETMGVNTKKYCFAFTFKEEETENQNPENPENQENQEIPEPEVPTDCCDGYCGNCVFLKYSEDLKKYLEHKGKKEDTQHILDTLDINPGLKVFLKLEAKLKGT